MNLHEKSPGNCWVRSCPQQKGTPQRFVDHAPSFIRKMLVPLGWGPLNNQPHLHKKITWVSPSKKGSNRVVPKKLGALHPQGDSSIFPIDNNIDIYTWFMWAMFKNPWMPSLCTGGKIIGIFTLTYYFFPTYLGSIFPKRTCKYKQGPWVIWCHIWFISWDFKTRYMLAAKGLATTITLHVYFMK